MRFVFVCGCFIKSRLRSSLGSVITIFRFPIRSGPSDNHRYSAAGDLFYESLILGLDIMIIVLKLTKFLRGGEVSEVNSFRMLLQVPKFNLDFIRNHINWNVISVVYFVFLFQSLMFIIKKLITSLVITSFNK